MARRSDHSRDEIREMALVAAEKIVVKEGYAGLSARKIAAEIGYTVGSLYLVFKNLDDLIVQVNGRTLDALFEALKDVPSQHSDPRDSALNLGRQYIAFASEQKNRWGMIFEHYLPGLESYPDWYREKVVRVFAIIENLLKQFSTHHTQREIEQASRALWGGVHGISILAHTKKLDTPERVTVEEITESLINNFIKGFAER